MQPRNLTVVHFDNDAGTDDAIALKLLASDPRYKIAAITVVGTGLAYGLQGANNMADLCNMLDLPNVPIAYGPDEPLDKKYAHPFPQLWRNIATNMLSGKNILKHPHPLITDDPVELLRKTLLNNEKVTIVATGALTNIARFFLKYAADINLISKIESIVIMGGAVKTKGNMAMAFPDNKVGEWNIANDAKAAQIVFTSGCNITLVPLDVTNLVPLSEKFYDSLSEQKHRSLKLTFQLLKAIVDGHGKEAFHKEFFLWDPLAIEVMRKPELATMEKIFIKIELATGRTLPVDNESEGFVINVATGLTLASEEVLINLIEQIGSHKFKVDHTASQLSSFRPSSEATNVAPIVELMEEKRLTH